jgi:SAM-dependent methyltransferase
MIERDASQRYLNTAASAFYLDRSKPSYIGGLLEMMNARLYPYWGSLTEGLKTGQPQNEAKSGGDLFAALYANPARLATFAAAMTGVTLPLALAIAEKFPWRDYKTIIDIGTAQGCLPVQLAAAHPHLAGGGFDLPPVRSEFEAYVARHGLTDRLRFYPGDFMRDPLPAADVLVMGHILHDWDLPTKKRLIAKAHAALAPGGALIVYDMMIDDGRRENAAGLLMSLNMLIETRGGFDYTSADCLGWLREAGFADARVERLGGPHAMAIGHKRS